jgi:iron(III) transport system substrate-binding protein
MISRRTALGRFAAAGVLAGFPALSLPAAAQTSAKVDPRTGTVRIYVSLATDAVTKLVDALKLHFPNLTCEFVRAGSEETVKRFVAERQAGQIYADLIHAADPGGFQYFATQGWLDTRLMQPSIIRDFPPQFYNKSEGWIALRATGIAPMYNTQLLKRADVPKTWREMVDPKWKGQIAISDPTRAGSSFSHLYAMWKLYGQSYLQRFAANGVLIAGDGAGTRNAIAQGQREIAPVSEYDAFAMKVTGAPVDVTWVEDGTIMVPAPIGLVKGSPNTDNALAVAAYLLSQEGQQIVADVIDSWSARPDVKAPPGKPELNTIKLAAINWDKASQEKGQLMDLYFKYFQS